MNVRRATALWLSLFFLAVPTAALACALPATVCDQGSAGSFPLIDGGHPARVVIDDGANSAVRLVAASFAQDLQRVSGRSRRVLSDPGEAKGPVVVIGVVGHSKLVDGLVVAGKLRVDAIAGQWEAFGVTVVDQPWPGVPTALVIAGADRRGAVFGTYDLSRQMGVSPWYWFADVPVPHRTSVHVSPGQRSDRPGVRYRGFFINDEDPAFSSWAKKHFGGMNAQMYAHVFELLLRLKGNYLWPAMWAPKAFHLDDPENARLANAMGVVMGTSHHEPLTRAQSEWHRLTDDPSTGGAWNYQTNGENLRKYWKGGLERAMHANGGAGYENLFTIGMRGDGDAPMSGGTATALLEKVVADQRALIAQVAGKPAAQVPQVWALYKEVLDYYDQGMKVPDDVTLLFSDDNWGQIRRLPTRNLDRSGGFGVYYHFDYVGVPRNYKWINTNQIGKVWQQMDLAWQRGARNIWIANVGDIKPLEYPLSFFMDMAWAPDRMTPAALAAYPGDWARQQFGPDVGADVGELLTRYSTLAARRKPELVDENTYATGEVRPDVLVRGEWARIIGDWDALVARLDAVRPKVGEPAQSAFFQLVDYPILAVSNLYRMHYATAWNHRLASQFDPRGNVFLQMSERAYGRDAELTQQYHQLNDGKWDGMMSQVHMNYVIWNDPVRQVPPVLIRTAGDVPEKMRHAKAVFVDPEQATGPITVDAADFARNVGADGLTWTAIPGLGQGTAGVVAWPQGRPATEPPSAPRLEYDVAIPENHAVEVRLRLSPTLDTTGGAGVRIGVSVDDGAVRTLVSALEPTGGAATNPRQQAWYRAVVDNRVELSTVFDALPAGAHAIKVWRLDDNVILEGLEVVPR
jgi:hypothetical protein